VTLPPRRQDFPELLGCLVKLLELDQSDPQIAVSDDRIRSEKPLPGAVRVPLRAVLKSATGLNLTRGARPIPSDS
jgi:hypothetical protein